MIDKESLEFKELEHVPKKSSNFFGTCSNVVSYRDVEGDTP
jgi:hypothetical protein